MKLPSDHPVLRVIALAALLPLAAWPQLVVRAAGSRLVWLYPLVAVAYTCLAWACARERATLAWVLVAMSLLTSAAIWMI